MGLFLFLSPCPVVPTNIKWDIYNPVFTRWSHFNSIISILNYVCKKKYQCMNQLFICLKFEIKVINNR